MKKDTIHPEEDKIEIHHESIEEIMGTPPARMFRTGSGVLFGAIVLLFTCSIFISHDDKIDAPATLQGETPILIVSPEDGRITLQEIGKNVMQGDTLMWLFPTSTGVSVPIIAGHSGVLEVNPVLEMDDIVKSEDVVGQIWEQKSNSVLCTIEIPLAEMSRVKIGNRVRLSFEKYPSDSYGTVDTTVKSISDFNSTSSARLLAELPDSVVTSENIGLELKGNVTATAEIIVGEQNLFNRLVNPFRGLKDKKIK